MLAGSRISGAQMTDLPSLELSANAILAQNLLIARDVLDITQIALANASGVSRATIAQLEAGLGDPRLSTIEQLAAALHVTPSLLLLTPRELSALTTLVQNIPGQRIAPNVASTIGHLVASPSIRAKLEAARIGAQAAKDAGFDSPAHQVGAALTSARGATSIIIFAALLAAHAEESDPERYAKSLSE